MKENLVFLKKAKYTLTMALMSSLVCKQNPLHFHSLFVGILFNSTVLGIYSCKTSQLYNLKTRPGGELCRSDVNIIRAICLTEPVLPATNLFRCRGTEIAVRRASNFAFKVKTESDFCSNNISVP